MMEVVNDDPVRTKVCPKCEREFPATAEFFHRDTRRLDGLQYQCKSCRKVISRMWNKRNAVKHVECVVNWQKVNLERHKENQRTWRKLNADKLRIDNRRNKLKADFGLTLEQYDQMFEVQGGVCAICGGIEITGKRLAVDHNHITNRIRGLLCSKCNIGLSYFEGWMQEFQQQINEYVKENE